MENLIKILQTLVRQNFIKLWNLFKSGNLHSQEYQECNWVIDIGEILLIYILTTVTTNTIKNINQK